MNTDKAGESLDLKFKSMVFQEASKVRRTIDIVYGNVNAPAGNFGSNDGIDETLSAPLENFLNGVLPNN